MTTARCIQALRVAGPWMEQKGNLHYLILEQGLLYFFSVSGFTLTALVLNFKAPAVQRLLNAYSLPVSGMMTARLLLHLRKWNDESTLSQTKGRSRQLPTLRFHVSSQQQSSYIEDFGEDPVRRAERNRLASDGEDNVELERVSMG
ncbi:hypothetical protein BDQ17DRAFT_1434223 [Cyathus striatus]|nr:hypothetical protein BDQ17DRAFT_1434223 [Cyathus striatus]